MKKKEPLTQLQYDVIIDEITDYLIEQNILLANAIYLEKYEEAVELRDSLILFIKDTCSILANETGKRFQTYYLSLNRQSDELRLKMIERINKNKGILKTKNK